MTKPNLAMTAELGPAIGDGLMRYGRAVLGRRARRNPDATLTDFDQLRADIVADPYPAYRRLLDGPAIQYNSDRDVWVISHYDAVRSALRADKILSSADGIVPIRSRIPMMLTMDDPEHGRLRAILARVFTPKAIADQRPMIEHYVHDCFDAIDQGTDVVPTLTVPLPLKVIADMLGVPPSEFERFRELSDQVVTGFELHRFKDLPQLRHVLPAIYALRGLFSTELARPRGDDLLGAMQSAIDAKRLDETEAFWFSFLLLIAGNETTTSLIGTLLHALATHPDQYELLRSDPSLIPAAIEEAVRWTSPIQGFHRTALADYEGIPAGSRVLVLYGAANRDPRQFPNPDTFDIARERNDHMGFGYGVHFCLGAHLARLEVRVVLEELHTRARTVEQLGPISWSRNPALRGPASLRLRLTPPGGST